MTPSRIGRITWMAPGVRPSISRASWPTATMLLSRWATATTDGSLMTMPRPFTYTRQFAVPRSTPIRLPNMGREEEGARSQEPEGASLSPLVLREPQDERDGALPVCSYLLPLTSYLSSISYAFYLRAQRPQLLIQPFVAAVYVVDVRDLRATGRCGQP